MYDRLHAALEAAGLDPAFGFPTLRHRYGTALAGQGVPMRTLQGSGWVTATSRPRSATRTTAPTRTSATWSKPRSPGRYQSGYQSARAVENRAQLGATGMQVRTPSGSHPTEFESHPPSQRRPPARRLPSLRGARPSTGRPWSPHPSAAPAARRPPVSALSAPRAAPVAARRGTPRRQRPPTARRR
jgi:hypothetical protein